MRLAETEGTGIQNKAETEGTGIRNFAETEGTGIRSLAETEGTGISQKISKYLTHSMLLLLLTVQVAAADEVRLYSTDNHYVKGIYVNSNGQSHFVEGLLEGQSISLLAQESLLQEQNILNNNTDDASDEGTGGGTVNASDEGTGGVTVNASDEGTGGVAVNASDEGTGGVAVNASDEGTGGASVDASDEGTGGVNTESTLTLNLNCASEQSTGSIQEGLHSTAINQLQIYLNDQLLTCNNDSNQ